jgi:hypothetical protein
LQFQFHFAGIPVSVIVVFEIIDQGMHQIQRLFALRGERLDSNLIIFCTIKRELGLQRLQQART